MRAYPHALQWPAVRNREAPSRAPAPTAVHCRQSARARVQARGYDVTRSPASRRSAGSASRISPASGVSRVVIVRIKALAPQLGRSPGVEVEQLEPTVVGHVHRGVGQFPSCWPGSIRWWAARSRTASLRWTWPPTASGCCVPKQVSKRRSARQFASPSGQAKRCSALAFCARSRIGKVREIGRSVSPPLPAHTRAPEARVGTTWTPARHVAINTRGWRSSS